MLDEIVAAFSEEIVSNAVKAIEGSPVGEGDMGVDGKSVDVGLTETPDGVVGLHGEAEGINADVAAGAFGIAAVAGGEFTLGEVLGIPGEKEGVGIFGNLLAPLEDKPLEPGVLGIGERLEGTLLRRILSVTLYPVFMAIALIIAFALVEGGLQFGSFLGTVAMFTVFGLIFMPLERIMPWRREWLRGDGDASTDAMDGA